jgi:predicted dinucleotide-binding enzyme
VNTIFGHVLAQNTPLDAFLAGDSTEAKAQVAAFLQSIGLRPLDTGGLQMASVLEWTGILLMGLARNGAGFNLALSAEVH